MIYEIAHVIKQYFSFLWDAMEWCNSKGFKVLYGKKLRNVDALIRREYQSPYDMRMLTAADCKLAADFFASQPESAFEHFRPHPFDEQSLTYIIHSGFISGYQNRYGDNLKPPTNVYHRMTA